MQWLLSSRFQSTLPRRERQSRRYRAIPSCHFNPRSREGSDRVAAQRKQRAGISIHAPAKGATGDVEMVAATVLKFQSTLPRRERRSSEPHTPDHACNFNPRSREGSDAKQCGRVIGITISIHAPAKGATMSLTSGFFDAMISIHAPAKGATYRVSLMMTGYFISIHAPAKGATAACVPRAVGAIISIHAPAKGATYSTSYR